MKITDEMLDVLGSFADYDPSTDCYTFNSSELRAALQAALAAAPQGDYPLPADLYDSKDWRAGDYAARVQWLHHMYEAVKRVRDALLAAAPQPAPDALREAARMALKFCEFCWRDVSLNDYAEEQRSVVETALRKALEE